MEVKLTEKNFTKEVLESDLPVLVDFWASWCVPCLMVAPAVEQIAKEKAGEIKVCKLNVDEAPGIAEKYGIQSIPTLAFFNKGKETGRVLGALPKASIENAIALNIA